jgi:hypothetical protein
MRLFVAVAVLLMLVPWSNAAGVGAEASLESLQEDMLPLDITSPVNNIFDPVLTAQQAPMGGYIPENTPYSNPVALSQPTPRLPNLPQCTVRDQTVVEIHRMRQSASRIAQMIQNELVVMDKRKKYIEQMTAYLNDRIMELNAVKRDLHQETRWIEISQNRIEELAEKEKLVKMQDIMACLARDQNELLTDNMVKRSSLKDLQTQSNQLMNNIERIRRQINRVNAGLTGSGSSGAGAPPA